MDTVRDGSNRHRAWEGGGDFSLNGLEFSMAEDSCSEKLTMLKGPQLMDIYADRIQPIQPKNLIEVGTAYGGSAVFLNELLVPDTILTLDIQDHTTPAFAKYSATTSGSKIKTRFGVDQSSSDELIQLKVQVFGNSPIDVVIDDASHLYGPSLTTFETLFPTIRPGGAYILEDWGWAHWDNPFWQSANHPHFDQPALSNLVFQLSMACASRPQFVSGVDIVSGSCVIWRGPEAIPRSLEIRDYFVARGKSLALI